jgi:hypothetical protein
MVLALLPFVSAIPGHLGVIPFLVAPAKTGSTQNGLNLTKLAQDIDLQKILTDMEVPPMEVGIQLDFDIVFTSRKPRKRKNDVKKSSVHTLKSISNKFKAAIPDKASVYSIFPRLQAKADLIAEHKYLTVVRATIGIVWIPLFLIWAVNKLCGKEFIIGILVWVLPSSVPASYIEIAVEDALWAGVFGVMLVATVGIFLVETGSLIVDVLSALEDGDQQRSGQHRVTSYSREL